MSSSDSSLAGSPPPQSKSLKRTRDDVEAPPAQSKRAAKRAKKNQSASRMAQDEALDTTAGINRAIGAMDSQLLADHIAQRTRRFTTEEEREELLIPASALTDTTSWTTERTLPNLPSFLEHYATSTPIPLNEAARDHGSPHTLVIAGAGLRAADMTRGLRGFQSKDAKVEKLFAKHIKLSEAEASVRKSRIGIGVGTPQRVMDLLDSGALREKHIRRIVVDASHIDVKKRGLLDMRETLLPLLKLLGRKKFRERYAVAGDKRIEVLLY